MLVEVGVGYGKLWLNGDEARFRHNSHSNPHPPGLQENLNLLWTLFTNEERITLMPGARTLVTTMAGHGAHCLLVSGGFTYFTSRVAAAIGFHADQGNQLMDDGAVLTGSVGLPILGRQAKLEALQAAAETHGLTLADSLAMGDGANDLAMISAAGLGLAVHAKPVVAAASDAAILHTDLTAALFFQGYTGRDIVWR